MSVTLASCNSSRRAARRIERITERHPELLVADTVKIDTLLYVLPDSDTAVFDPEIEIETDSCVAMHAAHGTFTVQKLPSRRLRLIYTPDTTTIRFCEEIPVQTVVINEQPQWRRVLRWAVLLFFLLILLAKINNELKKFVKG